uniref:Uncharacterized protein n=1 Tax=Anopheles atroparvus TaxID=41427 RepID=A0A182J8B2_ANOAO
MWSETAVVKQIQTFLLEWFGPSCLAGKADGSNPITRSFKASCLDAMEEDTGLMARICRFCLRHDGLMALSKVIGSAFTYEDVVYYTGIQISETEKVLVCNECCIAINKSVNFRCTCLSNDIIYKKIVSVVKVSVPVVDFAIVVDSDSQDSTEDNNFEKGAGNNIGTIRLDDTDSDDNAGQEQEESTDIIGSNPIQSNDRMEKSSFSDSRKEQLMSAVGEKKENENASNSKQLGLSTLQNMDDLFSASSPSVVVVRIPSNDKITLTLNTSESNVNPNDTTRGRTMLAARPWSCRSLKTTVDSDSDDSIVSLYSEVMAKADEELLEARKNELKMKRAAIEAVEAKQPPGGASAEERKENSTDPTKANLKTLDDADSDDSMTSLYNAQDSIMKPKPLKLEELCPYCGVLTRDWINHVNRTHIKERRFPCPRCPKKYTEKYYLKEHINKVHEKRIILTCELCGKGFINSGSHFYHMVIYAEFLALISKRIIIHNSCSRPTRTERATCMSVTYATGN